jgi:hypothetical protein
MPRESLQSALTNSSPPAGRASIISPLAWATFSSEPRPSRWAGPTFVMTPRVGFRMRHRRAISPRWFIPTSKTPTRWRGRSSKSDSGRPRWLFRLPRVEQTFSPSESTAAMAARVLVLPFEPVTATIGML